MKPIFTRKMSNTGSSAAGMVKKIMSVAVISAVLLAGSVTGSSVLSPEESYGAAKFPYVKTMYITDILTYRATVRWDRVRGISGYAVFKNGKIFRHLGPNVTYTVDATLKIGGRYTYSVKTYKVVRTKQWYNTATKKWQSTVPAIKYRGGSRVIGVRVYNTVAPSKTIIIQDRTAVLFGRTIKASQCPVSFTVNSTRCPVCKKGGRVATVTFNKSTNEFSGNAVGVDYSEKCHHHNSIDMVGRCGSTLFSKDGQINRDSMGLVNNQSMYAHSHNFTGDTPRSLADKALSQLRLMQNELKDPKNGNVIGYTDRYPNVRWHGGKTFKYYDLSSGGEKDVPSKVVNSLKYDGKQIYCELTPVKMITPAVYCYNCKTYVSRPTNW